MTARLPARLASPSPGWQITADVVVVGSGIAGLTAALAAQRLGRVLLVTKTRLEAGSTAWAQGGIAAAVGPQDSPPDHLADTVAAGDGLVDVAAADVLVREGPRRVQDLADLGARFARAPSGSLALGREGGHGRKRILHAGGDATGAEISRTLIAAVRAAAGPRLQVLENALMVDLLTAADGSVCGASLHVIGEGEHDGVGAALGRAVVLATGGLGQVYRATTNPIVVTGDGMAAALRAGADLVDLEFVQFHPTVLWAGPDARGQRPLVTEALRGEGAVLRDLEGRRFLVEAHPLAELAPRDVVARATHQAIVAGGGEHVWLDARHLGSEVLTRRFPSVVAACAAIGINPAVDLVPVAPAQHYVSGGVATDTWGRSSVAGLLACGEVAGTGAHGANRLASNSLLEGLVSGHRVAQTMAGDGLPRQADPVGAGRPGSGLLDAAVIEPAARPGVQGLMSRHVGVVRDADGLATARRGLAELPGTTASGAAPGTDAWETTNLLTVATVVTTLAERRTETRGGHWRSDHPDRDDDRWRVRQRAALVGDELVVRAVPVASSSLEPSTDEEGNRVVRH